jgi:hypothetical protein
MSIPRFEAYLEHLRWLVAQPSPFTEPAKPAALIAALHRRFEGLLSTHAFHVDREGNLIGLPRDLDPAEPTLYLSAHADTVPFDPALWTAPFAPHPAWEDAHEIVAQGVNDCKAGVAFQLWLAQLAGEGRCALRQVVFTITFKEEGAGKKSSVAIGEEMGRTLPAPAAGSTLLVLENTVTSVAPYVPQVYAAESGSYAVHLFGTLPELRQALTELPTWRPIAIEPELPVEAEYELKSYQPAGHISTADPAANPLRAAVLASQDGQLLKAGDARTTGTVPSSIGLAAGPLGTRHRLSVTERGQPPLAQVEAQLSGRDHRPMKPLHFSTGWDATDRVSESGVGRAFLAAGEKGGALFARNPGASDATMITASLLPEYRARLLPLVCGPGTRSQRGAVPPRLTHGPNETLLKVAAERSLQLLWHVLRSSGHLAETSPRS